MAETQKQIIELVYLASHAEAASKAYHTGEQKRTKEDAEIAKKAAKEAAEATRQAAKEQAEANTRAAKEAAAAAKEAADAVKQATKEQAQASKAAAREAAVAARQTAKEEAAAAKEKAEAQKEYQRTQSAAAKALARFEAATAKEAAKATSQAVKEKAAAWKEYQRLQEADTKALARLETAAAKEMARTSTAAVKEAAKEKTAVQREEARKQEEIERTLNRWSVREYRDRVRQQAKDAKAAEAEKKKAAEEAAKAWDAQQNSIIGAGKSVAMFALSMAGLNSVGSVLHTIVDQFNAIRLAGLRAAADILDEAGDLRQLGAMQGEMGQPTQQLLQQLEFRTKTLQTAGEARNLSTEAMSSAYGSIAAGRISDAEFQKHLITAGQLQKMTGAEPGAVGRMSGILPMVTGKERNNAADLDVLMERLYKEQKLGGFRDYGQAATQFAGSAEYVMKGVFNAPTAQALLSAFAMAGQGDTASERLSQVTTAVGAGLLRNRGMKINPEYESLVEKSGDYFGRLGVTPNTKTEDRIMAVVRDLLKAEDESKAKGLNWNPMDYLLEKGFINVQSRESIAKLAGVERTGGQLSALLGLGNQPLPATSGIPAAFDEMVKTEPWAAREQGNVQAKLAQFGAGMAGGMGPFREAMRAKAFGALGGETEFGANLEQIVKPGWLDAEYWIGGRQSRIDLEAQHQILSAAAKAGIKIPDTRILGEQGEYHGETQLDWKELFKIAQKTREAGGTLTPGADSAKTNQLLAEIRDGLKALAPGVGGAPPAAGPGPIVPPALPAPRPIINGRNP